MGLTNVDSDRRPCTLELLVLKALVQHRVRLIQRVLEA